MMNSMKVILYMAQTVNEYIARDDDSVAWSNAEWRVYCNDFKKPRT